MRKALDVVALIGGGFAFLAYGSYLIRLMFWQERIMAYLITLTVLAAVVLPVIFHEKLKAALPAKLFIIFKSIYAAAGMLYAITFIMLSLYIVNENAHQVHVDDLQSETVFIVYGAGLKGDKPARSLEKRLDKAIEMMNKLPGSYCVVTGGQGPSEIIPEATAMKNYLVSKGIDTNRIITEDKAINTIQNVKLSLAEIEKAGLSDYRLVSVSNAFHIPRIKLICERVGCESGVAIAEDPDISSIFPTLVREYMAYVKLLVFGAE